MSKARDRRKANARAAAHRAAWGPRCPSCGERASHFVAASLGEPGFFVCQRPVSDDPHPPG